jgi:hypothetical protein
MSTVNFLLGPFGAPESLLGALQSDARGIDINGPADGLRPIYEAFSSPYTTICGGQIVKSLLPPNRRVDSPR